MIVRLHLVPASMSRTSTLSKFLYKKVFVGAQISELTEAVSHCQNRELKYQAELSKGLSYQSSTASQFLHHHYYH